MASAVNVTEPPGGKAVQESVIEVPEMYGSVIVSDEWDAIMPRPGLYELPGPGGNTLKIRLSGPNATGGGVAANGMYYATSYENDYGSITTSTIGYDLESGSAVMQAWGNDATNIAVDLAPARSEGSDCFFLCRKLHVCISGSNLGALFDDRQVAFRLYPSERVSEA